MAAYIRQRPPRWFWLIGFGSTLWGALGVLAFVLYLFIGPAAITAGSGPLVTSAFAQLPGWFDVVYAAATLSALLGGLALLTRSGMARALFALSLLFLVLQFGYMLIGTEILSLHSWTSLLLPMVLIAVASVEIWFSNYARRHGWIC